MQSLLMTAQFLIEYSRKTGARLGISEDRSDFSSGDKIFAPIYRFQEIFRGTLALFMCGRHPIDTNRGKSF
jgi:hypothetical protein